MLDARDMEKIKELDNHYRFIDGKLLETESEMYQNIFDE
jgi:alcohol dehydrogenase (NADP+)